MPKKFSTENSKAVASRERKKDKKDAELSKKKKEEEDQYWKDDDKQNKKKHQRKVEQDMKKQQQLAKKAETKLLLEKEMSTIKSAKVIAPSKVTRAQISSTSSIKKEDEKMEKITTHLDAPLEENINRIAIEGEEAHTITEAINILSSRTENADKHPEKRMKAAYASFEENRLKELKIENPSLRLTQLQQMVFKEWQRAPQNPKNQQ